MLFSTIYTLNHILQKAHLSMAQSGSISVEVDNLLGLIEAFRAFDSDNDGSINVQELGGIMGSLGYNASEEDIQTMMQKGDTNGDGVLSMSEFLDMNIENLGIGGVSNALKRAFEALDLEQDDQLTGEELYQVIENMGIQQLSLEDCQEIVASIDGDGDGAISLEEFKLVMGSLD